MVVEEEGGKMANPWDIRAGEWVGKALPNEFA